MAAVAKPFSLRKSHCVAGFNHDRLWFKQKFIQDKIKVQRIVMCSSTSYSYSLQAMSSYSWKKRTM